LINESIKDYVKVYNNFLDKDFCEGVIKELQNNDWETHSFYIPSKDKYVSYDNDLAISFNAKDKCSLKLSHKIWDAIDQYILKDFKSFESWFNGWNGYTQARFNKYVVGTTMKEHCDHIHTVFDGERRGIPVLSIVGALNEDYEGGDFIMWETEKIELPQGSIMIFPSNFMYPHRVTPVTQGTRYSYVSWTF
jgi:predicted 2-oxoglutarate/Fe(II)-dependent dioxygenase YbiX